MASLYSTDPTAGPAEHTHQQMVLPQSLESELASHGAPPGLMPTVPPTAKRPASVMGPGHDPLPPSKRATLIDDTRVKALLKGLGSNLAAADKQYKELYSILLGETATEPKGPIGKIPHISPAPPPDAIILDTSVFVARYKSLAGTSRLEFWDSRQGTGTKLKFVDGKDTVIMGQFTKKATLCELLPSKEVDTAMSKRH